MPKEPVFEEPPDVLEELTEPVPRNRPGNRQHDRPIPRPNPNNPPDLAAPPAETPPRPQDPITTGTTAPPGKKRTPPNVALYLTPTQKRQLMFLKAELGMDYTKIVIDALRARHPQRGW